MSEYKTPKEIIKEKYKHIVIFSLPETVELMIEYARQERDNALDAAVKKLFTLWDKGGIKDYKYEEIRELILSVKTAKELQP